VYAVRPAGGGMTEIDVDEAILEAERRLKAQDTASTRVDAGRKLGEYHYRGFPTSITHTARRGLRTADFPVEFKATG
jgi:hypothetical protein